MAKLNTTYLGLQLKNPIVAASSGLTDNIKSIKELAVNGAAAVILKSIFEEEITLEYESLLNEAEQLGYHDENMDYFDYQIRDKNLNRYLDLIKDAKEAVDIPIIPSINCHTSHEWTYFAKKFEEAGADAIELNLFLSPSKSAIEAADIEERYFSIIKNILHECSIPISLKISPYFTNLGHMIRKFDESGISGIVMFNRFFSPDIDIEKLEISSSFTFSTPTEVALSMRWIATMARRVNCDLAATTGIHDGEAIVKQLLAGANVVQLASCLYQNGSEHIPILIDFLNNWMDQKGFNNLNHFRGLLSQVASSNSAMYDRVQFMKYFSGKF